MNNQLVKFIGSVRVMYDKQPYPRELCTSQPAYAHRCPKTSLCSFCWEIVGAAVCEVRFISKSISHLVNDNNMQQQNLRHLSA